MMFVNSGFGRSMGILEKTLNANRQRAGVIANNLANIDTPNFKRSDINFEAELKRAMENERNMPNYLQAKKTDARHIDFAKPITWDRVEPRRVLDYLSEVKNNGNNVDLDRESGEYAKTGITYDLLTTLVKFQFNQIAAAIR